MNDYSFPISKIITKGDGNDAKSRRKQNNNCGASWKRGASIMPSLEEHGIGMSNKKAMENISFEFVFEKTYTMSPAIDFACVGDGHLYILFSDQDKPFVLKKFTLPSYTEVASYTFVEKYTNANGATSMQYKKGKLFLTFTYDVGYIFDTSNLSVIKKHTLPPNTTSYCYTYSYDKVTDKYYLIYYSHIKELNSSFDIVREINMTVTDFPTNYSYRCGRDRQNYVIHNNKIYVPSYSDVVNEYDLATGTKTRGFVYAAEQLARVISVSLIQDRYLFAYTERNDGENEGLRTLRLGCYDLTTGSRVNLDPYYTDGYLRDKQLEGGVKTAVLQNTLTPTNVLTVFPYNYYTFLYKDMSGFQPGKVMTFNEIVSPKLYDFTDNRYMMDDKYFLLYTPRPAYFGGEASLRLYKIN